MNQLLTLALVHTSIFNIVIMIAMLLVWAKWATIVDKDTEFYYLPREKWNLINICTAVVAFALWLMIPFPGSFFLGLVLVPVVLIGTAYAYMKVHNEKAPKNKQWDVSVDTVKKLMEKRKAVAANRETKLNFMASHGPKKIPAPNEENRYNAHLNIEKLLIESYKKHAQELKMSVGEQGVGCALVIDGMDNPVSGYSGKELLHVMDYLKTEAELDVEDRRKKQKGKFTFLLEDFGRHKVSLLTSGNSKSVNLRLSFDPDKQVAIPIKEIGFEADQLKAIEELLEDTKGLVLVSAPPKQGLTTTLNALMQEHDPYMCDIHSIISEVTQELEGIHANLIKPEGLARTLDDIMLYDPNVVMIENLNDAQAAQLTVEAAKQARIYAGLNFPDTNTALKAWLKTIGNVEVAAEPLRAIISQRLCRKLCDACKRSYKPDADTLRKMNLPADKIRKFYKSSGKIQNEKGQEIECPNCAGLGYRGRVAILEVMIVDDMARTHLQNNDFKRFQAHLRKNRMLMLQEAALTKVISGTTSISEAMRAMGMKDEGGSL